MEARVQRRIYPEPRIKKTHGLNRILGIVGVVIGLGLVLGNVVLASSEPGWKRWVFGLVGLSMVYYGLRSAGLDPMEWFFALVHRRTWQRLQVTADGEIVERNVRRRSDDEGNISYTYWVTFRFDSTEGPVALRARVDKPQYDRLEGGQTVQVRYALDNPRLALIEGEWAE